MEDKHQMDLVNKMEEGTDVEERRKMKEGKTQWTGWGRVMHFKRGNLFHGTIFRYGQIFGTTSITM
jgi:hypothetical protein